MRASPRMQTQELIVKMHVGRRFAAAAVMASLIIGGQLVASGPASAATPQSSAMATLMQSYNSTTGMIGPGGWSSAVALSTLLGYRQATGDTSYDYAISTVFNNNKATNFTNAYMDDTAWWGIAWMQAFDATGNTAYLDMAKTDANYVHNYWDATCGGGVWWNTQRNYKNAITNELFLQLTAGLHKRMPGDTTYLSWANAEWTWFNGTGMINSNRLINDGLTSACVNNGQAVWTYSQGVILAGLAELSKATGNTSYLSTAQGIADAATTRLSTNGVLADPCEPSCGSDGSLFKGAFIRGLSWYAAVARTSRYDAFLGTQALSVQTKAMNASSQIGLVWKGTFQASNMQTQASGVDALTASITRWPYGAVRSGIAGKCMDVKFGASASGTPVQLWSCNNSVAQNWTAYGDGKLRIFGKCLDTGGLTGNNTKLQLWDCNTALSQNWEPYNGGYRGYQSGRCIDDPASSTTDGTQLQLFDCNGSAAQKWTLPASAPVATLAATSTIQAESTTAQSGTISEATTDTGGGQNVGAISNGDWLQYDGVVFGTTGRKTFSARVASAAAAGVTGTIEVRLDSVVAPPIGSVSITNTGGWQTWRTVAAAIS